LGGPYKRGTAHARTLLIQGARAEISQLFMGRATYGGGAMYQWLKRLVERRGANKARVLTLSDNSLNNKCQQNEAHEDDVEFIVPGDIINKGKSQR